MTDPAFSNKLIIALYGPKQSGKTSVAKILERYRDFQRVSFADPIRDMLNVILPDSAVSRSSVTKEAPIAELGGESFRRAAQSLGTEWGREMIWDDIWAHHLVERIRHSNAGLFVVDDLRFENEEAALRKIGAKFVQIYRTNLPPSTDQHISECFRPSQDPDAILINNGTEMGLGNEVVRVYRALIGCPIPVRV